MFLGLNPLAWLLFLLLALLVVQRIIEALKPMEPNEATVKEILRRYDGPGQSFIGPYKVFETSKEPLAIGFYNVVSQVNRQYGGQAVMSQEGKEKPEDWPVYVDLFTRRPYKKIYSHSLSTIH